MIAELEQYEAQQKITKNTATQLMLNVMNSYYYNLKNEVGIEEQKVDQEDTNLDDILKTLKPNTTA
jgi:hypothetical protein